MVIYYLDNDKRWTKIRDGEAVVHVKRLFSELVAREALTIEGAATGVAAQTTLREGRHGRGGHGGNGGNAAAHGTRREHHGLVAREARAIKGQPREWLHRRP